MWLPAVDTIQNRSLVWSQMVKIWPMKFNELQIPPPQHWQQFEDLCLTLFRHVWGDPRAQQNGRSGQPQAGTDISGQPRHEAGRWHGVQCKGKDAGLGAMVTIAELEREVEKAKGFSPALGEWILATSGPKDAKVEQRAREISEAHSKDGLFRVRVFGWNDLLSLMDDHPEVIAQHYPDLAPTALALKVLAAKLLLGDDATPIEKIEPLCRTAAIIANAKFLSVDRAAGLIDVDLLQHDKDNAETRVERKDVTALIKAAGRSVVEAGPGAGKTTLLQQLTAQTNAELNGPIAVFMPLIELAISRKDVIEEIGSRASFKGLEDAVARMARQGRLTVFFDGWNELTPDQRGVAQVSLDKFTREYPDAAAVVGSRALSPSPFPGTKRISVAPLARSQQEAILVQRLGPGGSELLTRARRVEGLRDVLQTPLYIDALAALGMTGELPRSKEAVLRRFVEKHRDKPENFERLKSFFRKQEDSYLEEIAWRMTSEDGVSLSEDALVASAISTSTALQEQKRITEPPQPTEVADALVSYHLLTEVAAGGSDRLFSFQHQQFQEWYASKRVEKIFREALDTPSAEAQAKRDEILNAPAWEEAIFFALDRLTEGNADDHRAAAAAILGAWWIDPFLAADMIRRSGTDTWKLIQDQVVASAETWLSSDHELALAFMIATGRMEFADQVWQFLNSDDFDRRDLRGQRLSPTVLGLDWKEKLPAIPERSRGALLWDMSSSGQEGIDFAIEALKIEPSVDIQSNVFNLLVHRATDVEIQSILADASPELLDDVASRHRLEDVPPAAEPILRAAKQRLVERLQPGGERTRILAELDRETPEDIAAAIEETLNHEDPNELQRMTGKLDHLSELYPEEFSEAIIARILAGQKIPYSAEAYIRNGVGRDQDALRAILDSASEIRGARECAACKLLTEASVSGYLAEAIEQHALARATEGGGSHGHWKRYHKAADILVHTSHARLASAILAFESPDSDAIGVMAKTLTKTETDSSRGNAPEISGEQRAQLLERLREWTEKLVGDVEAKQEELADVASAIARMGESEHIPEVGKLLEKSMAQYRAALEAQKQAAKEGRASRMLPSSYEYIFRGIIDGLRSDAARDLLVKNLGDPDFGVQAAFALREYAGAPADKPGPFAGQSNVSRIADARTHDEAQRSKQLSPVAAAVLDELDKSLAADGATLSGRSVKLATAAVQMDYGDRYTSIAAVLVKDGPAAPRLELIRQALIRCQPIDPALIHRGLDEMIAEWQKHEWHQHDQWWKFREWLELLPFTTTPEAMIPRLRSLPAGIMRDFDLRDLARACGLAGPAGLQPLVELTALYPHLTKEYEWAKAFSTIGTVDAARALVEIIFDPARTPAQSDRSLVDALGTLLRRHPEMRTLVVENLKTSDNMAARSIIATSLSEWVDEASIISILDLLGADERDPLRRGLASALTYLTTGRLRFSLMDGEQSEIKSLALLRSKLFERSAVDDEIGKFSGALLREITKDRLEYGYREGERRHPNLASGRPANAVPQKGELTGVD